MVNIGAFIFSILRGIYDFSYILMQKNFVVMSLMLLRFISQFKCLILAYNFNVLFFFSFQFGMMECVVTNVLDEYKHLRKNEKLYILIICLLCYVVAIPMVCEVRLFVNLLA